MAINTNNMIDGSVPAPTVDYASVARTSPGAPTVDPSSLTTQQLYGGETERRDALAELTALRREFKTETAAGAKAAAADPRFQAALQRFETAKSAIGMRTSAQDLQALNALSGVGTQGAKAASTQALNAPYQQYFQQLYSRSDAPPTWAPPKQLTPEQIAEAATKGYDWSNARYDWVWYPGAKADGNLIKEDVPGRWMLGVIGGLTQIPDRPETLDNTNYSEYLDKLWRSGSTSLLDIQDVYTEVGVNPKDLQWIVGSDVTFGQLIDTVPDLDYAQFQEILYELALERDDDITVQDVVDKYNEMYGEG